jgi:multidrug efflux pump subunit AcrA (membrane-fusion protein)
MTPHHIALITIAGTAPMAQQNQDIGQTIKEAVDQATREASQEAQRAAREARQQARDAQQQAREAVQQVRDAQQQVRDAQQQLLDAQQQQREATTGDQRGAAHQAVMAAQDALNAAQKELQRVQSEMSGQRVFTIQPTNFPNVGPMIPPQAVDIAIGFFVTCAVIVVGWPISRALGRRFERRGSTPLLDTSVAEQLQRIEQAVEAVAIEVERISESQRFLAKLQEKSPSTVE